MHFATSYAEGGSFQNTRHAFSPQKKSPKSTSFTLAMIFLRIYMEQNQHSLQYEKVSAPLVGMLIGHKIFEECKLYNLPYRGEDHVLRRRN